MNVHGLIKLIALHSKKIVHQITCAAADSIRAILELIDVKDWVDYALLYVVPSCEVAFYCYNTITLQCNMSQLKIDQIKSLRPLHITDVFRKRNNVNRDINQITIINVRISMNARKIRKFAEAEPNVKIPKGHISAFAKMVTTL